MKVETVSINTITPNADGTEEILRRSYQYRYYPQQVERYRGRLNCPTRDIPTNDEYSAILDASTAHLLPIQGIDIVARYTQTYPPQFSKDPFEVAFSAAHHGIPFREYQKVILSQTNRFSRTATDPSPRHLKDYFIQIQTQLQQLSYPHHPSKMPVIPAITSRAIFEFDIPESQLDPRIFLEAYCSIPRLSQNFPPLLTREAISQHYDSDSHFNAANLAGSTLLVYTDENDKPFIFLRKRKGTVATNSFSIPGGRSNDPGEPTGLRELVEETGIRPELICHARPLGTADQLLPHIERNGSISSWERFLNLVWILSVTQGDLGKCWPIDNDRNGAWQAFSLKEIKTLAEQDRLSPIAHFALSKARFI